MIRAQGHRCFVSPHFRLPLSNIFLLIYVSHITFSPVRSGTLFLNGISVQLSYQLSYSLSARPVHASGIMHHASCLDALPGLLSSNGHPALLGLVLNTPHRNLSFLARGRRIRQVDGLCNRESTLFSKKNHNSPDRQLKPQNHRKFLFSCSSHPGLQSNL